MRAAKCDALARLRSSAASLDRNGGHREITVIVPVFGRVKVDEHLTHSQVLLRSFLIGSG